VSCDKLGRTTAVRAYTVLLATEGRKKDGTTYSGQQEADLAGGVDVVGESQTGGGAEVRCWRFGLPLSALTLLARSATTSRHEFLTSTKLATYLVGEHTVSYSCRWVVFFNIFYFCLIAHVIRGSYLVNFEAGRLEASHFDT
jgi:hypothetical protein